MGPGGKALILAASVAAAGCTAPASELKVRAIADPATKLREGVTGLGEARAQLALGNVGLALEAFRKVQRLVPQDSGALAGIAACYEAMGRFDLARSNYEAALALSPNDGRLLGALASVLQRMGKKFESAQALAEARRLSAPPVAPAEEPKLVEDQASFRATSTGGSSVTVALPAARPAADGHARQAADVPMPQSTAAITTRASVTVPLPPARPADNVTVDKSPGTFALPAEAPPRLERLSPGEVALVTNGAPLWRAQLVARTRASTTVRWIPVRSASLPINVRLMNAARSRGLASRAREMLADRGWKRLEIGDAAQTRETSVVMYPGSRSALARRVAAQFGFRAVKTQAYDIVVVLLGRDSTALKSLQRRG